ncbi:MAG: hypothetical protein NTW86_26610, partial [Candidatus Sumerlaeota bacterium]|nr:hypothetical protein [Candidatus Sumerlaeota bacterium]
MMGAAFAQKTVSDPNYFLYFAVWDSAANDIIRSTIQRIRMPYPDYDKVKQGFIDEFVKQLQAAESGGLAAPGAAPAAVRPAAPAPGAPAAAGQGGAKIDIHLSLDPKTPPGQA